MGSRKGKPNNVTAKTRDVLRSLTDKTAPQLEKWLLEVYEQEGPNEAIKRYLDFAEFVMPKLARMEHTGEDGGPVIYAHTDKVKERLLAAIPQEQLDKILADVEQSQHQSTH